MLWLAVPPTYTASGRPLEDVHDHRRLPVLVVEGDLPLESLAQVIEGLYASQVALRCELCHSANVPAHLFEGFLGRSAKGRIPAVGVGVAQLGVGLLVLGVFAREHTELE
ncbi:MAG: hypothetical protein MUE59_13720 [Thiobacillaceae bacterium]|nr:hypothetical protein [Thiobacillaceae bacterium]